MAKARRSGPPERRKRKLRDSLTPGSIFRLGGIVVVSAFALLIAFRVSIAEVYGRGYPARALYWMPNHAEAQAHAAARLVLLDRPAEAWRLAEASLERSPLNAVGLRSLAVAAEVRGDDRTTLRLMNLANAVSRRDVPTQIWLISNAVRLGDYRAAVRRFDLAMRISSRSTDQLVPLLVAASADRRALGPIANALEANPDWKVSFLDELARSNAPPAHIMFLIRGRLDHRSPGERQAIQSIIRRLGESGRYDLAWALYRNVARPGRATGAGLRDGGFETSDGFPPFDWTFTAEPDLYASPGPRPDGVRGSALSFVARNGRSGEAARQLFRLVPGRYQVVFEAGASSNDATQRPRLTLSCATEGAPLISLQAPPGAASVVRTQSAFAVPANCGWIWARIAIGAGESVPAADPWMDNLLVRPAQ